jgi:hypothetical protein
MRTARATSPCHSKKYCHNGAWPSPTHHGVGLPGVQEGDDGPFPLSLEHAVMQGKARGVRDPRPLGPGWTSLPFPGGHKYCHNGGMAFAHHHGVGLPGGPRRRSWPLPAVP